MLIIFWTFIEHATQGTDVNKISNYVVSSACNALMILADDIVS